MALAAVLVAGYAGALCRDGAPALAQPGRGVRGDGVAAVVGGSTPGPSASVVLHSEVELVARIALTAQSGQPFAVLELSDAVLGAALDEIVGESLIAREAERVQVAMPTPEDGRREWERIEQALGGPAGVRRFLSLVGADEGELRRLAERRARVAAFLRANLSGAASVSDAEVERLYESGEHPFIGQDLDSAREPLRVMLAGRRVVESVTRWIQVLRARTVVRLVAPYGRVSGEAAVDRPGSPG